jgi:hypothetical protein
VLDARRGTRCQISWLSSAVRPERLLADDVLARLGGRDRRLGVEVVRREVVEQLDARVATSARQSVSKRSKP